MDNSLLTNLAYDYDSFKRDDLCFDISMRNYPTGEFSPVDYVRIHYPFLRLSQIKGVYGFHEMFTPLYGGRPFNKSNVLTTQNLLEFYNHGIHYYIPLSNHFIDEERYEEALPFLEMHHRPGNTVACVSDSLAKWIRRDFPEYRLSASVIKNLTKKEAILGALEIYDSVVIPATLNNDLRFLKDFEHKDRLVLFANNFCRYTCPSWGCYEGISREINTGTNGADTFEDEPDCSKKGDNPIYRDELGYVVFNLDIYYEMGYRYFKLIPPRFLLNISQQHILDHKEASASNGQKRKSQPDISRDVKYVVPQDFKRVFKSKELRFAIRNSKDKERKLFCELNSILPVFKTPFSIVHALDKLKGRFSVSEDSLQSFLQTLICFDLLIETPPQFEQPVFIISIPMVENRLLFDTLSQDKAFWTVGDESNEITEGIPQLHPSHREYDSDQLNETDASVSIQRLLIERYTKYLKDSVGTPYYQLTNVDRPEKVRLLDNNGKNVLRIPFLTTVFPDAKFIFIYREPEKAITDLMEGWRSGKSVMHYNLPDWPLQRWSFSLPPGWRGLKKKSLKEIATFQWRITDKIIRQDLNNLPQNDWRLVKYDDFIEDSIKETTDIYHFINHKTDD